MNSAVPSWVELLSKKTSSSTGTEEKIRECDLHNLRNLWPTRIYMRKTQSFNWEKLIFCLCLMLNNWETFHSMFFRRRRRRRLRLLEKNKQTKTSKHIKERKVDIKIYEDFFWRCCFYQTIIIDINDSNVWNGMLLSDSEASSKLQNSTKQWKRMDKLREGHLFVFTFRPSSEWSLKLLLSPWIALSREQTIKIVNRHLRIPLNNILCFIIDKLWTINNNVSSISTPREHVLC